MLTASLDIERDYHAQGRKQIAGIDEAGRGAWAGPVAAGAVVLPTRDGLVEQLRGARDSKTMTPAERARLSDVIQSVAAAWGIGEASVAEIASLGIVGATKLAMRRALLDMNQRMCHIWPDVLFIDHVQLENAPVSCPQIVRPKFDSLSLTVACASILAKHWRDAAMKELDARHPGYGFAKHKGYGTPGHITALDTLGPCEAHRMNFQPLIQRRLL
ncbi:MAG: ribonuclease HII [Chloroflexi bacterium]|nr:ribonuclease HII [Chloroflexota bacterium]